MGYKNGKTVQKNYVYWWLHESRLPKQAKIKVSFEKKFLLHMVPSRPRPAPFEKILKNVDFSLSLNYTFLPIVHIWIE